jgi:hypothetical protein
MIKTQAYGEEGGADLVEEKEATDLEVTVSQARPVSQPQHYWHLGPDECLLWGCPIPYTHSAQQHFCPSSQGARGACSSHPSPLSHGNETRLQPWPKLPDRETMAQSEAS